MKLVIQFTSMILLLFSLMAQAQAQALRAQENQNSSYQEEIQERAKRRVYPGGQDEADLKVQTQLISPTRKIAPVVEDTSEPVDQD